MIINAFLRSFDRDILLNLGIEMLLGIVAYAVSFIIVCLCFRKSDASVKGVLKFMTAFCNVGFMGLPVLKSVFGDQGDLAVLYGTGIVVCHNVLTWTVGVKMLAPKGQKDGAKKALLNPGVLACVAGAILFAFSANEVMPQFLFGCFAHLRRVRSRPLQCSRWGRTFRILISAGFSGGRSCL